jgi:DNA-binding NarL/FixJ family response regulator
MRSCGTVLVVDRDEAIRDTVGTLARRLGRAVIVVDNGDVTVADLDGQDVALAVIEVELPSQSGLELLREIHERFGESIPVILLSGERTTPLDHVAGLLLGADDYVAKPFDEGELLARMHRSLRRGAANGNGHAANGSSTDDVAAMPLTPRELEILRLLSAGLDQAEIARRLVISPKTVGTHIQHVLSKLGVRNRTKAVAEAYRRGLVEPDFEGAALEVVPAPD